MAQPGQPTSINLAIRGLYLNPSTFGGNVPEGALHKANDVVIDRPGVVATRRGFYESEIIQDIGTDNITQFGTSLITFGQSTLTAAPVYSPTAALYPYTNMIVRTFGGNISYKDFVVPDYTVPGSRIRSVESNKRFYFITGPGPDHESSPGVPIPNSGAIGGTYLMDSDTAIPRLAGAPPGLGGVGVTSGTSGFLPSSTQIAYRVVFGYKDATQAITLGAPSSRIVIQNTTASPSNCVLTFQQPDEVQLAPTNFFFQVYRGHASPDIVTEPDDEMALAFEGVCTSATQISITDSTPDTLLGAALYTNQGQEGILQSNYRPPLALDVCLFKQFTFYANTRNQHQTELTLLASGFLAGAFALVPGNTITFTTLDPVPQSFVLTAGTLNNAAVNTFAVSNTGNAGFDLQATASNIVYIMNAITANKWVDAYYISTGSDLPGKMQFVRNSYAKTGFTVTSSNGNCWAQTLPITSSVEIYPNRVYFSKFNQPGAVPVVNYIELGSANKAINRIIPLRDGVMVLKQDGVFRISNAAPPFTITPIDYNVRILADNSAAELDNKVYFLSDQGIVALSDSDAQIMSFVLDKTIIENTTPDLFPNLQAVCWGVAYQSDRKYILGMPVTGTDVSCKQQYVYNHLTQNWTRWTRDATCGFVDRASNRLYLGSAYDTAVNVAHPSSVLWAQRNTFTDEDYTDETYDFTLTGAVTGATTVVTTTLTSLFPVDLVGYDIIQTTELAGYDSFKIIAAGMVSGFYTFTINTPNVWANGPVIVSKPIFAEIETIQIDCQNPGMNKQFNEMIYMFTDQSFNQLTVKITSNTAGVPAYDYLVPGRNNGWGIDAWGTTEWGGTKSFQGKVRRFMPQKMQRAGWLFINISNNDSYSSFGLSGIQLPYKNTSTREK